MMRIVCVTGLVVVALATTVFAAGKVEDSLAVRIVPTRTSDKGVRSIDLYRPSDHFHVVITNVSKDPIRLWREWCSWGYYALSFRIADENGKTTEVRKGPRAWTRNAPDAAALAPGDHMVLEVAFDQDTWPDAPLPGKGNSREVRMKAVFAIQADEETKKAGVWTGEVASPEETYTIYR